jgi:hypothetical protein
MKIKIGSAPDLINSGNLSFARFRYRSVKFIIKAANALLFNGFNFIA